MSIADRVFIENCRDIISNGVWDTDRPVRPRWEDGSPAHTVKLFGVVNRYDLSLEFPIMTLRKTGFRNAIDELLWIWQKKSNNIHDLHSHIWDAWADENGSIGKAYGYQLGVKHHYPEGDMDQVDRILYDLKHNPGSRRIYPTYTITPIFPKCGCILRLQYDLQCIWQPLNAILNQRSQDMLVANNWNVCQYAVLVYMMAQVSGLEAGMLMHVIADAHIYDRHVPLVEELISREPLDAPRFIIDKSIDDFYKFTVDSFSLEGYESHGSIGKIPVAV